MQESPLNTVFYNIEKAIKLYRRMAQKRLRQSSHKITLDQVLVLWMINNDTRTSQAEIGEILFKDNASIGRIIELLVKESYIERSFHDTDRRRFLLNVTSKGQEVLKECFDIVLENRSIALEGVSASEIKSLNKTLFKIINNCQTNPK